MFEALIYCGLAAVYLVFVWTAKNGPGGAFAILRRWIAEAGIPFLSKHLLCPTCVSLSFCLLLLILYQHVEQARFVIQVLAGAGLVLALHGMAGYWHGKDE